MPKTTKINNEKLNRIRKIAGLRAAATRARKRIEQAIKDRRSMAAKKAVETRLKNKALLKDSLA
jgi:hypothetical protein